MKETIVQKDSDGELFILLSPDELYQMGWDVGDEIIWEETEYGYIAKKQD